MRVYNYDAETKEYTGFESAMENPERKGDYLIPANATTVQVSDEYPQNTIPVFNGIEWELKEDFRGKSVINLEDLTISKVDYIGEIKDGFQIIDAETEQDFILHPECYKVVDNEFKSIVGTDEYAQYLENEFEKEFIKTNLGYVRINTAWGNFITIIPTYSNIIATIGFLPADSLILYNKPEDFKQFKDVNEVNNWLVTEGQFSNNQVSQEDFLLFSQAILNRFQKDLRGGE